MSPRKRDSAELDYAELPLPEDALAEAQWLMARERDPGAPPPSPEIAADYAELERLLAELPLGAPDDGWHDEVLRKARAAAPPPLATQPWWRRQARWKLGGLVAAAALVVVLLWVPPGDVLEVAIRPGPQQRGDIRRGDTMRAVLDDQLVIQARPDGTGDLRVYRRDGKLVGRCPDGPGCSGGREDYLLELRLDAPGQYDVVLVTGGAAGIPVGSKEDFLAAAHQQGADVVAHGPIIVE